MTEEFELLAVRQIQLRWRSSVDLCPHIRSDQQPAVRGGPGQLGGAAPVCHSNKTPTQLTWSTELQHFAFI